MKKLTLLWPPDISVTLGQVNPRSGWRENCEISDGFYRLPFKYDHAVDLRYETQDMLNSMISRLRSERRDAAMRGTT